MIINFFIIQLLGWRGGGSLYTYIPLGCRHVNVYRNISDLSVVIRFSLSILFTNFFLTRLELGDTMVFLTRLELGDTVVFLTKLVLLKDSNFPNKIRTSRYSGFPNKIRTWSYSGFPNKIRTWR